tara:strand:+ start:460 stop:624 length:165 start_codon:yes stop_codon:yes gene_type:complete
MKNLLKTWTTQTLKETQINYLNAMTHYTGGERKTQAFKQLKAKTELITAELKTR